MVLHQETAEYDYWIRLLFLIPIGLLVGAIFLALSQEYEGFSVLIGDGAFLILLFYFIMPRKYEIYEDKLRIVLGTPFSINIPLSTIKEVKHASASKAFIYTGVRFATSSRYVVEVVRSKGFNYIIAPKNGDVFIGQLNQAIERQARNRY
jgi:hypothetical protein